MPYNCLGDLTKFEIVNHLNRRGCHIKNVHQLNLIFEEMGILIHSGKYWFATDEGMKYSIYNANCDSDAWHPELEDKVFEYLKSQGRVE